MKNYLVICALFIAQQALADIYQCREKDAITFVDASTKDNFKHCVLVTERKTPPSTEPTKKTTFNPTTETIKIDAQTQEARDAKRKQILLSELKTEQDALKSARNAGAANDVRLHQENIKLINNEIKRIK